jgi:hypothetical protein
MGFSSFLRAESAKRAARATLRAAGAQRADADELWAHVEELGRRSSDQDLALERLERELEELKLGR